MYLEITPNGSKYWRLKYRWHKKQKLLALGVYPGVTLKDEREKREIPRKQLASGYDPSAIKKEAQQSLLEESQNTFECLASEWQSKNKAKWSEKHADSILYLLEKDIYKDLGNLPVRTISPVMLLNTIRKMEARGAHELARKARGNCEQILLSVLELVVQIRMLHWTYAAHWRRSTTNGLTPLFWTRTKSCRSVSPRIIC